MFSCSVMSNYLQPHGLHHARLQCPSPIPGVYSNSCPSSHWCHRTISTYVVIFSFCLQFFQALGSSLMSLLVTSGGHNCGVSAWASVLSMTIQDQFLLGLTSLIFKSKGLQFKTINSSVLSFLYGPTLTSICDYWKKKKKHIALTRWTFGSKAMSLLFNMLSRFVIAFLPRNKHLLISWLQSISAVIWEPKKIKSVTVSIVSPSICHEVTDQMPWSLFLNVEF